MALQPFAQFQALFEDPFALSFGCIWVFAANPGEGDFTGKNEKLFAQQKLILRGHPPRLQDFLTIELIYKRCELAAEGFFPGSRWCFFELISAHGFTSCA